MENEMNVVEQIHNEFDTAAENLLEDAKKIINQDADAASLRYLGFKKVKRVINQDQNFDARRMSETVRYYTAKYPFYKFISPLQVKVICEKYGLYLGGAEIFIGEIPEKNINEILKFRLLDEDMPSSDTNWVTMNSLNSNFDRVFLSEGQWCEKKEETFVDRAKQMQICAPSNMFELTRWDTVKDGYKIVCDPIVLQPVKGGYIIVTKWGKESNDELVINEIHN